MDALGIHPPVAKCVDKVNQSLLQNYLIYAEIKVNENPPHLQNAHNKCQNVIINTRNVGEWALWNDSPSLKFLDRIWVLNPDVYKTPSV